MFYFRDELEKEAVLTPSSALKAMQSKYAPIRYLGKKGADIQEFITNPKYHKPALAASQGAYGGENFALNSAIASGLGTHSEDIAKGVNYLRKQISKLRKNPTKKPIKKVTGEDVDATLSILGKDEVGKSHAGAVTPLGMGVGAFIEGAGNVLGAAS